MMSLLDNILSWATAELKSWQRDALHRLCEKQDLGSQDFDDLHTMLKTALKADIDPDAWETLNRTISRPFDPPQSGKIAVKVINHYGDEVLKVYEVEVE